MLSKNSYTKILFHEFENRCKRNPSYSLRAFARDVGLSPASLSLVMNGKQGLSLKNAEKISERLQFNPSEKKYFCTLVESKHARSKTKRDIAANQLTEAEAQNTQLTFEYFNMISSWHHFAILELTQLDSFQSNPNWIAQQLGISIKETRAALQRLLQLELLEEKNKKYQKTVGPLFSESEIPHRSIKNYHHQILKKASNALEDQSFNEREFGSAIFAMDENDLEWAKQEMKQFRKKLSLRLAAGKNKTRLYQLSLQLFSLNQNKEGTKNEK